VSEEGEGQPRRGTICHDSERIGGVIIILDALTEEDVERVRVWRNASLEALRTPYMLTKAMQGEFYRGLNDRASRMRFWAIREAWKIKESYDEETGIHTTTSGLPLLIGMGGFTDIQWENRNAEISLIIDPELRGKGYGEEAVDMLLKMAFNYLNLHCVYAEVYKCNETGLNFWNKIAKSGKWKAHNTDLIHRKYWNGKYWDSVMYTFVQGGGQYD
jgi:RimJ/RimL family protein N-acetyltransferase